ncbi:MAG: DUF3726 domain-containing protein, partial [Proteobacteria bacterium]|nr:DUF3726 domain-containing protein [Pseudomonadota bacterium]
MIVTLNEVQRTCQKAMSGAGAPAGVDDDAAMAAAWLEGRGLPALGAVAAALDRWAGDASAMELAELPPEGGARRFDAAGRSALFVGGGLIDLAVAMAAETTAVSGVEVAGVTDPRFFLPPAVVCPPPACTGVAGGVRWSRHGRGLRHGRPVEADHADRDPEADVGAGGVPAGAVHAYKDCIWSAMRVDPTRFDRSYT